jgi:hypothetical protein
MIWSMTSDGRNPRRLGVFGGIGPVESPDGRFVYCYYRRGIWRLPSGGGEPREVVVDPEARFLGPALAVTDAAVYYLRAGADPREIALSSRDLKTGKRQTVRTLPGFLRERAPTFDVSPDGRAVIYPHAGESETDLLMLAPFR